MMNSPSFLNLLHDSSVKTVLMVGTGGGFDFTGANFFIPALRQSGKKVIIHSYSFGTTANIQNPVRFIPQKIIQEDETVTKNEALQKALTSLIPATLNDSNTKNNGWPTIVIADSKCKPDPRYGPECAMAQFLDKKFPTKEECVCPRFSYYEKERRCSSSGSASSKGNDTNIDDHDSISAHHHWIYTSYARDWTAKALKSFYEFICLLHDVDAILCLDGGSDSLVKVDPKTESGFGDPIEDAVTVAAVAKLPEAYPTDPLRKFVPVRVLVALGFGCDRFNGVSDETSFQAIAELTRLSRTAENEIEQRNTYPPQNKICGFLGSMALERFSPSSQFYTEMIEFTQENFSFRSVIANSIIETMNGAHGSEHVPESLKSRVPPGSLYLWPLMSFAFGFDIRVMYSRSHLCSILFDECNSIDDMYQALFKIQKGLK